MGTFKHLALGVMLGTSAFGSTSEKVFFGPQATCSCKGKGDCTCARGQCKCKHCGNDKAKLFDTLKGSNEPTVLPGTARVDARGGVFI